MPTPDLLDPSKEHSLVLIKPDGVRRGLTGEILHRIEQKGFVLKGLKIKKASARILEEHYEEHVDRHYFPALRDYMMEGPLVAVVVEGDRVIEALRIMAGATNPTLANPGTIRGDLGRDWGRDAVENVVHSSDSPTSAIREIAMWFPELSYDESGESTL